ncbi:magnesium transporter [Klebsiella pneumoniae subsp. rhinoscleromatis]|nr:magnesium transporter [Klebsiella pneumoniae subsp. rhinoscleromatis]
MRWKRFPMTPAPRYGAWCPTINAAKCCWRPQRTSGGDLIDKMSDPELLQAMQPLDIDEQVYLLQHLPRNLTGRLLATLPAEKRARIRQIMRYADNSVGSIMEFEVITVRPEATLAAVQRYLRRLGKMPENTDKLFVTTRNKLLLGELELQTILLNDAQKRVGEVMEGDPVTFQPHEEAEKVARTFERDDLLSAAVIDADGKLIGRLTIDEIVDVVYEETDNDLRRMGGLSDEEDVFAPVSKAVKTRWAMAGGQSVYGVYCLPGHRRLRTHHFTAGGAGLADADRRRDRRQHRQPDDHHDRPGDGAAADPARQLYLSDPA